MIHVGDLKDKFEILLLTDLYSSNFGASFEASLYFADLKAGVFLQFVVLERLNSTLSQFSDISMKLNCNSHYVLMIMISLGKLLLDSCT